MTEKEMQLMLGKHFGIQYICIPQVNCNFLLKSQVSDERRRWENEG